MFIIYKIMRIISKYKDYYDYLSGIYGEDSKLILDRRDFDHNTYRFQGKEIDYITLYICGYRIDGVYKNGDFYYGDQIKDICDNIHNNIKDLKYWWNWKNNYYEAKYYSFTNGRFEDLILGEIVKDKDKINQRENCPILLRSSIGSKTDNINVEKFPILQDIGLPSFIDAKTIYQWLVDWLSQKENEKEIERGITITNIDKLKSKGFDPKKSFRPNMK